MIHHRTNDPAERALSIAQREAEHVWQGTGNYDAWSTVFEETYDAALRELQPLSEGEE